MQNDSMEQNIISCHLAYCQAAAIEPEDLILNVVFQRWWYDMLTEYAITPDDVKLIVKGRLRANRSRPDAHYHSSIQLSGMLRRDDQRAVIYEELLTIKSKMRIKTIDPARAAALRATGRDDQPPAPNVISMQSSKLLEDLRRAAS